MNRKTVNTVFPFFPVICSQLPITQTPDNSNLFQFPLRVRVIESRLYSIGCLLLYLHVDCYLFALIIDKQINALSKDFGDLYF